MLDSVSISSAQILTPRLTIVPKAIRLRDQLDKKIGYLLLKRSFDICFSAFFILTVLSWLLPILSILIKLTSKGPIFFKQKRIGRGGRSFICYKLRTMVINKEADVLQASENDNRITSIGRFLRESNMDEFPQFFNVLKGDMSVIGPRPHMYADCLKFSAVLPGYKFRNMVKPGLTGLAQIKGYHGPTTTRNCILMRYHFDNFYIRNLGLVMDISILLITVRQRFTVLLQYALFKMRPSLTQKNKYTLTYFKIGQNIATIKQDNLLINSYKTNFAKYLEKCKLYLRAKKYQVKEDRGGIDYINRSVKKGDIVFDIGAHKAGYLYFFLKRCGTTGKIIAFEPQSVLYRYLTGLKNMFSWNQVVIESMAVSVRSGNAWLCIPYNSGRDSSPCATIIDSKMDFRFQLKENVNTISLDEYCFKNNIYPNFLKVDVEGNELSVFKGAKQLLKTHKPKILFESEARFVGTETVKQIFQFLTELGYQGRFIKGDEMLSINEFDFHLHQNIESGVYCNNFIFE